MTGSPRSMSAGMNTLPAAGVSPLAVKNSGVTFVANRCSCCGLGSPTSSTTKNAISARYAYSTACVTERARSRSSMLSSTLLVIAFRAGASIAVPDVVVTAISRYRVDDSSRSEMVAAVAANVTPATVAATASATATASTSDSAGRPSSERMPRRRSSP